MVSDTVSREIYAEVLPDFPDGQKVLKHCRPAERLKLDLISDDQAGKRVISVMRSTGERIGCLEQDVSDRLIPELETGSEFETMVLLVTDGGLYPKRKRPGKLFSERPRHCYVKITA